MGHDGDTNSLVIERRLRDIGFFLGESDIS